MIPAADTPANRPVFDPDEPVLQQHYLFRDGPRSRFGDDVWDLSLAFVSVNRRAYQGRIDFAAFPSREWVEIAKTILMARLNPRHHLVVGSGVHRGGARGTTAPTILKLASHLRLLAVWAGEHLPLPASGWSAERSLRYVESPNQTHRAWGHDISPEPSGSQRLSRAIALRSLYEYRVLLGVNGLEEDPFGGQALHKAVGLVPSEACTGPLVPTEVFWPLLRAAWTYISVFGSDILRARDELGRLQAASFSSDLAHNKRLVNAWLDDPSSLVPVHTEDKRLIGRPNLRLLLSATLVGDERAVRRHDR